MANESAGQSKYGPITEGTRRRPGQLNETVIRLRRQRLAILAIDVPT